MITKLSDYLKQTESIDSPGTYEFYELESSDRITKRFIIKNINNGKTILIRNKQNKIEIDNTYTIYGNIGGKLISIMKFFEKLKGLGVTYI